MPKNWFFLCSCPPFIDFGTEICIIKVSVFLLCELIWKVVLHERKNGRYNARYEKVPKPDRDANVNHLHFGLHPYNWVGLPGHSLFEAVYRSEERRVGKEC